MKTARRTPSWWVGLALLIVAAGFAAASFDYPLGSLQKPGPGAMPQFFALVLGICAAGILFGRKPDAADPMPTGAAARTVIAIAAMALLYPLALKWLGFLISTVAMVWGTGRVLEMTRMRAMWFALVAVGLSYVLFALVLGVPLPDGPLGF